MVSAKSNIELSIISTCHKMAAVAKSKFRSQCRRKRQKWFMDGMIKMRTLSPSPATTASGKKLEIATASPHDSTSPLQVHVHEPST